MDAAPNYLLQFLFPIAFPFIPGQRIYWLYLVSALIMAFGVYLSQKKRGKLSLKAFWNYCFPREIYFHKSAKVDYLYFIVNKALAFILILPFVLSAVPISKAFSTFLNSTFGAAPVHLQSNFGNVLLYTILLLLAADLGIFITHYLQHKIRFLWEFHKVHHSAEVLTPITVYRMHPIDDIFNMSAVSFFTGLVEGFYLYFAPQGLSMISFMNVNVFFFAFYLLGYNLRHSHIWLNYGPFWGRVLISPAQHQIHHSKAPEHIDKNFGFIFAFWDIFTHSLYIPKKQSEVKYGLSHREEKDYSNVWRLFALPFQKNFLTLMPKKIAQ